MGPLPKPTTEAMATEVMVDMVWDTDTERGPLMPMHTMAMEAMAVMEAMVLVPTDMARGPLMPMPTTATEAMASAMAVMEYMDTARGPLMLMPTTATEAMASAME